MITKPLSRKPLRYNRSLFQYAIKSGIVQLTKAKGASAIFAVTNFWEHIQTLGDHGAGQKEYDQILRIASAAGKTASLDHFVLHSLPSGEKLAGKDYLVPHWDYKDKAADEIQRSLPELAKKTTFLWVGWFASNFHNPLMRPVEIVHRP